MVQVQSSPGITSQLINKILSVKAIANLAKSQARNMMIKRAEKIGVPWRKNVEELRNHDWQAALAQVENKDLSYPDYYVCSFHAYETGNLNWDAALEVESAACAVHAKIWPEKGKNGDSQLRENYHQILREQISIAPQDILDIGCGVGMSTFPLQAMFPQAKVTGLDLSPYFLAVAQYNSHQRQKNINWLHSLAEATGLPDRSFDLISSFLTFHELPQVPSKQIFEEVRRLLRPGGYFAIMDMNPQSQAFKKMPPYVFTLLKSTEPYLDDYFTLDIEQVLIEVGFKPPTIMTVSPRHRAIIAGI